MEGACDERVMIVDVVVVGKKETRGERRGSRCY